MLPAARPLTPSCLTWGQYSCTVRDEALQIQNHRGLVTTNFLVVWMPTVLYTARKHYRRCTYSFRRNTCLKTAPCRSNLLSKSVPFSKTCRLKMFLFLLISPRICSFSCATSSLVCTTHSTVSDTRLDSRLQAIGSHAENAVLIFPSSS
jgi:hypothetical protein